MNIQDAINIFKRGDLPLRSPAWGLPIRLTEVHSPHEIEETLKNIFSKNYPDFSSTNSGKTFRVIYSSDKFSIACVMKNEHSLLTLTLYGKDAQYNKLSGEIFFKIADRLRRKKVAFEADIFVKQRVEYKPKKN